MSGAARGLPALCAALMALLAAPAHADRPLVSETADAIEAGSCQVEAALARARAAGGPSLRSLGAIFSCGLKGGHQWALAYGRDSGGGEKSQSLGLGGKSNLLPVEAGRTGLGVAYSLAALKTPGSGYRFEDSTVLGVLTRELGAGLLGHANLGWTRSRSARQSSTLWSLGVETTGDVFYAADVFGDDRNRPSLSAGAGYSFAPGFSGNVAYALQFDKPRSKQLSLGLKVVF
jgi:hypothetical protein